jgi:hypothetical protein
MVRIRYDNGPHTPTTFIGFGTLTAEIEAGVRFTASQNMQLANIDAFYRNESDPDSIQVKVYAAGANDSTPGALLYTKTFGGLNYNIPGTGGDYVTLPLDSTAPSFVGGTDFWVSILFAPGIPFPMGAQVGPLTTPGHSFYSPDSGATWFRLVITPNEYAWLLRVVGIPTSIGVPLNAGWNMISNPVTTTADSVQQLFPNSQFPYAFRFVSGVGYQQDYTMENGPGFWGKFPGPETNSIAGTPRPTDSIAVVAGWNMVGSVSGPVDTSTITSNPDGIRASDWFGYSSGYFAATTITPGLGYWVKANAPGKFYFASGPAPAGRNRVTAGILDRLNTLTIKDNAGGLQTLYFGAVSEGMADAKYPMPPLPPVGAFDARFESSAGGMMVQIHPAKVENVVDLPITIQSVSYPLTVSWKVVGTGASYELSDGVGGQAFASKSVNGEGSMTITRNSVNRIVLKVTGGEALPTEYALMQNYPNPFNPVTSIRFALPVDSRVNVEVFNVVGQRVRTLLNEEQKAGYHLVEWNGSADHGHTLGSGVYFLRLSAQGNDGSTFNETRKLMLLK